MAETEPKVRKAAVPAALAHGGGDAASDGTEEKERAPKTVAGLLSGSARLWHRWRSDVLGVGTYAAAMSFSCFYASEELMQPPDAVGVARADWARSFTCSSPSATPRGWG
ncbi:unnamed protein product [Prorocentrum cordatum]|uniref:Mitochondrial fission process protein 1 n=1 Tax=Prorocentrum cordatum TaxID=2364126 RepID=A0ABN9R8C7_9DINO|nr:unnamed protein product [Polarella glacialis]